MIRSLALAIVGGLVIGALAWVDPLFIPLVLAGPVISGAVAGAQRLAFRWVACAWAIAGLSMIVSDWIRNHEDRLFHALLTLVMVGLASGGWLAGGKLVRRKFAEAASEN